jgi:hypothetical protein
VTSRRHVRLNIIVDSYYPGINDFDIDLTRLRVRLVVLK